jgi:glycosyltransferase involved in cell wall biosynthesis
MKSILVITHDTSLSGAPKSLLLILQQLKKFNYNITVIAIKGNGLLEKDFIKVSKEYYNLENFNSNKIYSIKNRIFRLLLKKPILSELEILSELLKNKKFDFLYINTINGLKSGLRYFYEPKTPLILHIHELKTVIDEFLPELEKLDRYITHYIVPSKLNHDTLTNHFNIKPEKISVIRETSTIPENYIQNEKSDEINSVVMCGGAYWRKGDDLFIQIAAKVIEKLPLTHFYWVGFFSKERLRVNTADIEKLGFEKNIHLIQETTTPEKWINNADLFLLTSREDPFPLAAMEAAMAGLAIICFEKATGISELIDNEMVIPYLDVDKMAYKTIELLNDKNKCSTIGKKNKETFSNLNPKNIAIDIDNLLNKIS